MLVNNFYVQLKPCSFKFNKKTWFLQASWASPPSMKIGEPSPRQASKLPRLHHALITFLVISCFAQCNTSSNTYHEWDSQNSIIHIVEKTYLGTCLQ